VFRDVSVLATPARPVYPFHEKAGMSQGCFSLFLFYQDIFLCFFPTCGFFTFEPGRPVAILPSALLLSPV
jgi:hypothetical protein